MCDRVPFTAYGPIGRPDMSIFRFIKWIMEGEKLQIYGDGLQERDFTYIEDIAEGTERAVELEGFHKINLGNNNPCMLMQLIHQIEKYTGKKADLEFMPSLPEDMKSIRADITKAVNDLGWKPDTNLEQGIRKTVNWMIQNWEWAKEIKV